MALLKSSFRKVWSEAKDAALLAYDRALTPDSYLDRVEGTAESAFPVKFDQDLGPILDKVDSAFKRTTTAGTDKRKELTEQAKRVIAAYRHKVDEARPALDKLDKVIARLLDNALTDLDRRMTVVTANSRENLKAAVGPFVTAQRTWKDAKKKSEKAHKAITANKVLGPVLKEAGLDKFPFLFTAGLSPLLDKTSKKILKADPTARGDIDTIVEQVGKYRDEVLRAEKSYTDAIGPRNAREWLPSVLEPLRNALDDIESIKTHLSKR